MKVLFVGTYIILASILPVAFLIGEFPYHYSLFLSSYAAVFIYPLFFGWIGIVLMVNPVFLGFGQLQKTRRRLAYIVLVGITIFLGVWEFSSVTIAPWEIKTALIQESNTNLSGKTIIEYFEKPSTDDNFKYTQDEKRNFENLLVKYTEDISNWSITRYFYIISFLVQAFYLMSLFLGSIFFVTSFSRDKKELSTDSKSQSGYLSLVASYIILLLWILFRMSWLKYNVRVYPDDASSYVAQFSILILFGIAIVVFLGYYIRIFKRWWDIISLVFGFVSSLIVAMLDPGQILVKVFGPEGDLRSYFTILFLIAVLAAVFFLTRGVKKK